MSLSRQLGPSRTRDDGRGIPDATVARLPVYHRVLRDLADDGVLTVSSEHLALACGVSPAKLRKDLSHLGSYGTRGVGYDVSFLIRTPMWSASGCRRAVSNCWCSR